MVRHEAATRDANEKGQILVSRGRNEAVHLYKALILNCVSQDVFFNQNISSKNSSQ